MPADLQHVFVDQVFFAELKAVGIAQKDGASADEVAGRGYQMINTMFPSSLGYTANSLDHNTKPVQLVKTGDLDMRHATIQTRLGGDISIFGPGGNIIVGIAGHRTQYQPEAARSRHSHAGRRRHQYIHGRSVLVNSSRVLTTQGGDILMCSSNSTSTPAAAPRRRCRRRALQVLFDQNDLPVDRPRRLRDRRRHRHPAGIDASRKASNLYLMAPRGQDRFRYRRRVARPATWWSSRP